MAKTKIEWCDEVWNPVWGCKNNCEYCYARKIAARFGKCFSERNFIPVWMERNFNRKFARSTKRVFVNSMSDPMHWEQDWFDRVLERIKTLPEIDFIFLTKGSSDVYNRICDVRPLLSNVILGLTRTSEQSLYADYGPYQVRHIGFRWLLNIEPILTPFVADYDASLIHDLYDWLIIGAETGNNPHKAIPSFNWYSGLYNGNGKKLAIFIKPSLKDITPSEYYLQQFPERDLF